MSKFKILVIKRHNSRVHSALAKDFWVLYCCKIVFTYFLLDDFGRMSSVGRVFLSLGISFSSVWLLSYFGFFFLFFVDSQKRDSKHLVACVINMNGCGSVGRAVASNSRGPRFESNHWQKFIELLLSTVLKRRK